MKKFKYGKPFGKFPTEGFRESKEREHREEEDFLIESDGEQMIPMFLRDTNRAESILQDPFAQRISRVTGVPIGIIALESIKLLEAIK